MLCLLKVIFEQIAWPKSYSAFESNLVQSLELLQTRFQKSWDTVQIVNKKGMQ